MTATATAEAAPEASSAADEPAERCWRATVAGVLARKRMLGAFLEESRFVGVGEDRLTLAMDDLHRAVIEEKENRAIIAAEVLRAFGRSLELRCAPADTAGPGAQAAEAVDVNAMIERAVEWFHGEAITPSDRRPERDNA